MGSPTYKQGHVPSVLVDTQLSTMETGPNALGICIWVCSPLAGTALGKVFSSIKDFLVPEVEPEAGFYHFSFKQVELSRDNLQTVDRPHSFAGVSVHQGPVETKEDPAQRAGPWAAFLSMAGTLCRG